MTSRPAERWLRLDELLHRHAPRVAADLRPAPAPVTLGPLLAAPWCPPSVVESLEAHDGAGTPGGLLSLLPASDDTFWPPTSRWLSIDEALAERAHLDRFFPDASTRWYPLARSSGRPVAPSAYEAGTVRLVVVDARGEELLAVAYHWQDGPLGPLMRLGLSWSSYLDDLARQLASGHLTTSHADGSLLLATTSHAHPGRRLEPAEALLAALVDRDLLHLSAPPSEALLAQVRRALGEHGPHAQAAHLVATLPRFDEVTDLTVSTDELAALLASR